MPNPTSTPITVRTALPGDARAIIQAHYDAVHITAAKDYAAEILDDWSSAVDGRVNLMESKIRENLDGSLMLVAELNNQVVGFAEIVAARNELRAVYVSPVAARMGVGTMLLNELELQARKLDVKLLWLDSSLTAEPFYFAHGYKRDGVGEHELRSGRQMLCVKMHKDLI